ncbi:SprT family zinc-dependent metalloprotease [Shewanella sp. Isolate11]|uniref:SprT family zinc-dependent metalloprotease n=1 Tax=Shewanella sp. Isolate11 TaxID=2908530 RepID=UPI001EFD33B7|nr:SprT family zinc-dependent metalloprotease [Shewanella sp. Isolate11]MCG9695619.1 SprT family zinc-dependent metalloprotease [Shewanella sp. Isolate11]
MYRQLKAMFSSHSPRSQTRSSSIATVPATDNQSAVIKRVESCYLQAEQQLNRRFSRPEVNFKLRGKSAGTAHLQLNKLRFNATLLEENPQAFLDQVVAHEICHLLAHQLFGRVKPHGKEWQSLMVNIFGLRPDTTHNLDISSVEGKTFTYYCNCGPVHLTIRRHNKIRRQQTQYRCRRCKQTLTAASTTTSQA